MARRLFVTGTDTDVGKTVVSACLTLGLDAYYWKPIQAGTEPATDTAAVRAWTGLPQDRFLPEAYSLRTPMSPHGAAAIDGIEIDQARIVDTRMPTDRPVIVEGAGGLLVPLNATELIVDLVVAVAAPVVLVARTALGTLNHTLLSLEALRRREIPVLGVVLNGEEHVSNQDAIERYGDVRVLGRIPPLPTLDRASLRSAWSALEMSAW